MQPTIFISYRRDDAHDIAARLYDRLADRLGEETVFMDTDTIRPGDEFPLAISEALDRAGVIVAVIGERWASGSRLTQTEDYVRREIEAGLESGARLIPVLVDGAPLPASDAVPPSLRGLLLKQAFTISRSTFRRDVGELLGSIEQQLGAAPGSPVDPNVLAAVQNEARRSGVLEQTIGWYRTELVEALARALRSDEQIEQMLTWDRGRGWIAASNQGVFKLRSDVTIEIEVKTEVDSWDYRDVVSVRAQKARFSKNFTLTLASIDGNYELPYIQHTESEVARFTEHVNARAK